MDYVCNCTAVPEPRAEQRIPKDQEKRRQAGSSLEHWTSWVDEEDTYAQQI
uniref:Uncharacterized protein n=1 Tax=Oryza sativa subsp. japonica TaxID=39947 RepID=Q6K993_ORYSJ|nr:hypothetical protein [Oryza sativa Japonica Group]BAD19257.1 hypothetical protein [Oryza sativa Japonica Group]